MNLFFGKITNKIDAEQLTLGYYSVKDGDLGWLNGIQPGDYSYIIGGNKVQLWRAESWNKKNNTEILNFEIIHNDLGINTKQLTAIKNFLLDMNLIVFAVRSTAKSKKAFFKITFDEKFNESVLTDKKTYSNQQIYRKTIVVDNKTQINENSEDIQIYKENGGVFIYNSKFISKEVFKRFQDNTKMIGKGSEFKDKTIKLITESSRTIFSCDELSILSIYDLFFCDYKEKSIFEEINETSSESEGNSLPKEPNALNLILYGPPGTGKTYNTINKALEIIIEKEEISDAVGGNKIKEMLQESKFRDLKKEEREALQKAFKFFKEKEQIEFITFHQSYSYEDFVEGIKPIPPNTYGENDSKEMIFKNKSGVFKAICEKAKTKRSVAYNFDEKKIEFHKMSLGDTLANENDVFEYCINESVISLGYGGEIDYSSISSEKEIERIYSEKYPNLTSFGATAIIRFKNKIKKDDIVVISRGNRAIRAIGKVTGNYYYNENTPINFNHFRKVDWLYKEGEISVKQILNDKWLSQQSIYTFYNKDININGIRELISGEEKRRNYVLIIDEINRGNISKIFGELITLIEDDKRLGTENEMTVTLPYSKESFGVPANLHIIGTMNTADRSIALMDMALRRRFTFEEMMPRTDLLNFKVNGIEIDKLLDIINKRIEFLYDRDHTIGHAYFIKLKDMKKEEQYKKLCSIFANKIIPLLQEYFYENWEKIQIVLGDHKDQKNKKKDNDKMVLCDEKSETDVIGFNHPEIDDRRKIYSLNDTLKKGEISPDAFTKIYE